MGTSKIHEGHLLVDGRPFHMRGGEIQYFRLRPDVWEDRLKLAKDGGLNTVTSYMPWYFHEPVEGQVDLEGSTCPGRNLRRFMELLARLDLKVVARPGPFINGEARCGGMPEWLFRNYPQTMSRRADGQVGMGRPLPAEGEPLYRQYVRRWYKSVVPLIAEFDCHRGGPVILFQPDNELSAAWSFGLLNSLYDPEILSRTWPGWLKRLYQTPEALAERYGCPVRRFEEVEPPRAFPATPFEKRRCVDWMNFKRWFFADWGATMAKWAMEDGIQVPMIFNEPVAGFYEHGDHAGCGAVLKQQGIQGVTACHTYSPPLVDLEGAAALAMTLALTRSSPWGGPAFSVEANTNWYIPRLSRSEINWEPLLRLGLASGWGGMAVYTYTAEEVSLDDTLDGPEYFAPGCIDSEGKPSGSYWHLRRFNRFVQAWESEINASEPVADLVVAYSPGQRYRAFPGAPPLIDATTRRANAPGGESFSAEPALNRSSGTPGHDWLDGYEAVSKQTASAESGLWKKTKDLAVLLGRLNLAFDMVDLANPNREPGKGVIVMPCTGSTEKVSIDYLLKHIDHGGKALFFPTIPVFDLDGRPDHRLAERLGMKVVEQIRPAGGLPLDYGTRLLDLAYGGQSAVNGWILIHAFPAGSHVLASHNGKPVIATDGQVVVAGGDMLYVNLSNLRLWRMVLEESLLIRPEVVVDGNYHRAMLRKGKEVDFLTVMNVTGRSGPCRVDLRSRALSFDIELKPHEARCLALGADVGGRRMVYTTSEIMPLNDERGRLALHGCCGTPGQIAFAVPVEGVLNGKNVVARKAGDVFVIDYRHEEAPLILELKPEH